MDNDNYIEYQDRTKKKPKYFFLLIIIIVIIIAFFVYRYFTSYSFYERKMVREAQKYVQSNHLNVSNEIFLDVSKLGMSLPHNCSLTSGVLYNGQKYTSFLSCNNYQSDILKNEFKDITLLGDKIITILKGTEYVELGYFSTNEVKISGNVGSEEGVYNLYYMIDNQYVTRKIIVLDRPNLIKEFPSLTLIGDEVITLDKNQKYQDMGVRAYDNIDGDITQNVQTINYVNSLNSGEYKVIYKVTNSRGYTKLLVRKVLVTGDDEKSIISGLSTYGMTKDNVKIIFNILKDNYANTILPNNEVTTKKNFEYEVSQNGTYEFKIKDIYGNTIIRKVEVNNINKEKPNITCVIEVYPNYNEIVVTSEQNKNISKYQYYVNGVIVNESTNNKYRLNNYANEKIEVNASDNLGNNFKTTCNTKNMDPTVGNNLIKYYYYNGQEYVIPNTKNDLSAFEGKVCNKISQLTDKDNCYSACLSVAEYYGVFLQRGDLSRMSQYNACNYNYQGYGSFKPMYNKTKNDALKMVYNEIINGKVVVLQVTGTTKRVTRHFVTVVGYRRDVYNQDDLKEEDLLAIDAWTGCFITLSYNDLEKRTLFDNNDEYGYRVNLIQ